MDSSDLSKKYQKLDPIEHVLKKPGMWIGNTSNSTQRHYVVENKKFIEKEITVNPGLQKLFDEIISNSVDEHIRSGKVNRIEVNLSPLTGEIEIKDDGGIPVQKHPKYGTWIPQMIFGELMTGSNFSDEERHGAGTHGLGAKLTSIFSETFRIVTCDGKKELTQVFENNLGKKHAPKIVSSNKAGTTIQFTPDYERLGCSLDEDNQKRIEKRVYDIAGCNPKIKVFLNGELIKVNKFKDYISMFVEESVEDSNEHWEVAVAANKDDTFRHVSFVNGVDTFNGGSHIDYVVNQITAKLREYIKKKHKIDVKPNNIKQQLFVFINCRVNAPMFTSQTKEFMSSDSKDFGTEFEVDDKFINKIVKSDVVQRILDWAEAQQRQKELAELRKMNNQTQKTNYLKKIVKFDDATSKKRSDCVLYIVEGDSAGKAILSARDPKQHGVYPLKGKPLNVRDIKVSKLTGNQEFADLMSIIGLKLGESVKAEDLRFGKVVLACDADPDGQHIIGLVLNMFQQFWPNLIEEGVIHKLVTPQIVATANKKPYEFFNRKEYDSWNGVSKPHTMRYYKGLGSWSSKDFKRFLSESKYLETLETSDSDFDCVDLAFDKRRADDRKEWLMVN